MAVDGSIKISTKIDQSGFVAGRKQLESGLASITRSLKGVAIALGLAFGTAAILNFSKSSVRASTELTNALIGLQSIVEGQGRSFRKAQQFINSYIKDGLIPATQAITAYKNLALRGYDDSQIQQVLIALKDSAAFGRQASYTLGKAVESATEGLKNENSILVDNAGVTKNVAKMWEEYAKSIGTTANNLTKQQKIQAEVLGIMEETRFQVGDAAKLTSDFSGQLLRTQFLFNSWKVAIGNAIKPIAQAVIPSINAMIVGLTRLANLAAQVTTALFGKQAAQQKAVASSGTAAAGAQKELAKATEAAGKAAVKSLAGFDELNVLQKDTDDAQNDTQQAALPGLAEPMELPGEVVISPTIEAAVDKIKSLLEPLQQINFENLKGAFEGLKIAIAPITQSLFDGLEWAYRNLLIPMATWVIQDAAPIFLDMLGAAANVLAVAINALKPLGQWLWETFLKPLGMWTGGVIITVLEKLTAVLNSIAKFVSNHGAMIRGWVIGVAAAFGMWKFIEFANYVQYIGALSQTKGLEALGATVQHLASVGFSGLKTAILGAWTSMKNLALVSLDMIKKTALLLIEIGKQTMALIANAAQWVWSKICMAASTIAQIAMTAATAAWNAMATIATAITTAFGAAVAFLTSPIGLVILAIAALIAIVVLLVQNWDWVKEVAIKTWNSIVAAWNVAAAWFKSKVVEPIQSFFAGLWSWLTSTAQDVWGNVVAAWQGAGVWFDTYVVQPIANFFKGLWDGVKATFTLAWDFMTAAFKGYVNGWITIIEGFINFFIGAINLLIDGLNKISISLPDWDILGDLAGLSWGLNISQVPSVKIPRLATGAVIPPNAEFLAVLGDQKRGTNIEAPLDTIVAAVMTALDKSDLGGGDMMINNILKLDGEVIYQNQQKVARRRGKNLIMGV